jgi:hypothetical protein
MNAIRTREEDWSQIKSKWSTFKHMGFNAQLESFKLLADTAVASVHLAGDIGSLDNLLTRSQIQKQNEDFRNISAFCKSVHEDLLDDIDNPFFNQIVGYAASAYNLDPISISLDKGSPLSILGDFINTYVDVDYVDNALAKDFLDRRKALSLDDPSDNLEALIEAQGGQWRDAISYDDMKEIERINFAAEEKARDWNNHYKAGDAGYPYPLADVQDTYYDMMLFWAIKDAYTEDNAAYYTSSESGVYINMKEDRNNPRDPYSTFFHETGHMFDNTIVELVKGTDVTESTSVYLSDSYNAHGKAFYDCLVNDVNNYIKNFDLAAYNSAHGTSFKTVNEAINDELSGAARNEFSDLFGGVTDNKYVGSYGHWDSDESFLFFFKYTDSYWDFDDKTQLPSMERLNKEAFAHFTEMSIMQNPNDLRDIGRFFPTAYNEYSAMIADINKEFYGNEK